MSESLKEAILRHPKYVSGDDRLITEADIVETAMLILDRMADENNALATQAKAFEQLCDKRLKDAQAVFEAFDFGKPVSDVSGWDTDYNGGPPVRVQAVVYLTGKTSDERVTFVVEWDADGNMSSKVPEWDAFAL